MRKRVIKLTLSRDDTGRTYVEACTRKFGKKVCGHGAAPKVNYAWDKALNELIENLRDVVTPYIDKRGRKRRA